MVDRFPALQSQGQNVPFENVCHTFLRVPGSGVVVGQGKVCLFDGFSDVDMLRPVGKFFLPAVSASTRDWMSTALRKVFHSERSGTGAREGDAVLPDAHSSHPTQGSSKRK